MAIRSSCLRVGRSIMNEIRDKKGHGIHEVELPDADQRKQGAV
jgi:hypothetical protein